MEAEVPDSEFPRSFTPGKRKFQVPDKIQIKEAKKIQESKCPI